MEKDLERAVDTLKAFIALEEYGKSRFACWNVISRKDWKYINLFMCQNQPDCWIGTPKKAYDYYFKKNNLITSKSVSEQYVMLKINRTDFVKAQYFPEQGVKISIETEEPGDEEYIWDITHDAKLRQVCTQKRRGRRLF